MYNTLIFRTYDFRAQIHKPFIDVLIQFIEQYFKGHFDLVATIAFLLPNVVLDSNFDQIRDLIQMYIDNEIISPSLRDVEVLRVYFYFLIVFLYLL